MKRVIALAVMLTGCQTSWRAEFHPPPAQEEATRLEATAQTPFLKVHTVDGHVFVLDDWMFDEPARVVRGQGIHWDETRRGSHSGAQEIPYDRVALLETNRPEKVRHATSLAMMGVISGITLAGVGVCLANPKACFGSCPTFYVDEPGGERLVAEGFSDAVARVMESTDVDALSNVTAPSGPFTLRMTNDALETHFVRRVELLAVPMGDASEVVHTRTEFIPASSLTSAQRCTSELGDCTEIVRTADELEYLSPADEKDLATREHVELEFAAPAGQGDLGVVITGRNSLMNTFLFYQALAYMGTDAGLFFAKLEGGNMPVDPGEGQRALLGDLDVQVQIDGRWSTVGSFSEVGPLAREVQAVRLPVKAAGGEPVAVRLHMAKGYWKVDRVQLARLSAPTEPRVLEPRLSTTAGGVPTVQAQAQLADPETYLITYPGDAYALAFEIPEGADRYALFVRSQGYYYEWIREQWLPEQSRRSVRRFFRDPARSLRKLAPAYKEVEANMEPVFWRSKFQG